MTQNADAITDDFLPGEVCMDCGRPYDIVWAAPDTLWNEVVGGPTGMLCPECFYLRCTEKGIYPYFVAHREHVRIKENHP